VRRKSLAIVLVVLACVAGLSSGLLWWLSSHEPELRVFDVPTSFCAELREKSFLESVRDVDASTGSAKFRIELAGLRANLMRQVASIEDTPRRLGDDLRDVAAELERAGRTGDYTAALASAAELDEAATDACV
jgi:hypothetical protein